VAGRSLDEPEFDQVFGASEELGAPFLLHPSLPLAVRTLGPYGLTCAAGFLMDTTTAILRLIFCGTFDRHPELRLILGHAGSLLPQLAGRIDLEYERGTISRTLAEGRYPTDYMKLLYTDTVAGSATALRAGVELLGPDRVMLGSDYPFWSHDLALGIVRDAAFDAETIARITGRNAVGLFGLPHAH
jgi:aminocarboxymuconate-semialdehyde decarboxylase